MIHNGKTREMDTGNKTIKGITKINQGTLIKGADSPPQTREIKDSSI